MTHSFNNESRADLAPKTALLLLAVGINALEYLFPRIPFLPWLKPGLANAVTIIWIIRWGAADALLFTAVRTWITSFYFGFSLVSLALSLSGGLLATAGMGVLWKLFGKRGWIGCVGLGVAGAALHNFGQVGAVYLLLTATTAIWYQAPFMLAASILFGLLSGLLGHALLPVCSRETLEPVPVVPLGTIHNKQAKAAAGLCIIIASIAIALIKSWPLLVSAALCATSIACLADNKRSLKIIIYPIQRFWLLFLFVAVMYLFFSYGQTLVWISFLTREGVVETLLQWLRLWTWIEFSLVLARLEFNRIALQSATTRLPFGRETFSSALMALELFPAFFDLLKGYLKISIREVFRDPAGMVERKIERLFGDIRKMIVENSKKPNR